MRWQFNTPIASHLKRWWETIEEARARWVEKWVKWVKVSPEVAGEVKQTKDLIPYILDKWDLKSFWPELEILPIITSKKPLNEFLPIIKKISNKPLLSRAKDVLDQQIPGYICDTYWLPRWSTLGDYVKELWRKIEERSRSVMEWSGDELILNRFIDYNKINPFPKLWLDWWYYWDEAALIRANELYYDGLIKKLLWNQDQGIWDWWKDVDWNPISPKTTWAQLSEKYRFEVRWWKVVLVLKPDELNMLITKLQTNPNLNPETDKLAPNPNLNPEIDKSQPFPDHDIPIVNKPNSDLGKSND